MLALCGKEPGPGVLVYVDDVVAGWCSIAPRISYRRLLSSRTIPILDDRNAWVAVCFVVRAGYRRHGLMHRLLDGAVDHASSYGAEVVEGYPVETGGDRVDVISGTSARSRSSSKPASSVRRPPKAAVGVARDGSCGGHWAEKAPDRSVCPLAT
jgi:GNAT superfamily N-acetyltransferase